MRKKALMLAGIATLTAVTGVAAQQIPGLDTEAIERQAQKGGEALGDFVKQALTRSARSDGGAGEIVAAGTKALANAPDSLRSGAIQGVDLDQIIGAARNQARGDGNPAAPVFIAFASTSMPEESLKRMIADVSAAGGTVVFRGFNIQEVPAYVAMPTSFPLCDTLDCVSAPPDVDKISGNVTTAYALQTFADGGGPGAAVARAALARLEHAE